MTAHICENSPAKAQIRQDVTRCIQAFVQGAYTGKPLDYASLCGSECTQEEEIRSAIPASRLRLLGFEKDPVRWKKAQANSVMKFQVLKENIDRFVVKHEFDIAYLDYCCTPLAKISKGRFIPMEIIESYRNLLTESQAPKGWKHDSLLFFTFALRPRAMSNEDMAKTIMENLTSRQINRFQTPPDGFEAYDSCPSIANCLLNLFTGLHHVHPVMYRVYHGGDGSKTGTPMMTVGLLISKDLKKYEFSYRQPKHFMVQSIEYLGENQTTTESKEINDMTESRIKQAFSLAVRTLSDKGYNNAEIATALNVSRQKVGAVMAWHKNRASWA